MKTAATSLLLIVSSHSYSQNVRNWDAESGAITSGWSNEVMRHWSMVQAQINMEGFGGLGFYLYPKNEYEKCSFGYSEELTRTTLRANGERVFVSAGCLQNEHSGTGYFMFPVDEFENIKLRRIFEESSSVKVEHDIAVFTVSTVGFTKAWRETAAQYKSSTQIDFLAPYRYSARNGDLESQLFLGYCYAVGDRCPLDYKEAFKWSEMAAQQGSPDGQMMLGRMYQYGNGVVKDYREAAKWFKKAAEQGHASSQYFLGMLYWAGDGVIKDNVTSHMWINIAAANGYEKAKEIRKSIEVILSNSQLEVAYNRARQCYARNYKGC
ncbi:MAG: sel1 repeat family protein [Oceanospirillales bacterium]|nr:sel1 repeat family protein [Oceanospirillales bacterium]